MHGLRVRRAISRQRPAARRRSRWRPDRTSGTARARSAARPAAEEAQHEHVDQDVLDVIRVVREAVGEQLVRFPRPAIPVGRQLQIAASPPVNSDLHDVHADRDDHQLHRRRLRRRELEARLRLARVFAVVESHMRRQASVARECVRRSSAQRVDAFAPHDSTSRRRREAKDTRRGRGGDSSNRRRARRRVGRGYGAKRVRPRAPAPWPMRLQHAQLHGPELRRHLRSSRRSALRTAAGGRWPVAAGSSPAATRSPGGPAPCARSPRSGPSVRPSRMRAELLGRFVGRGQLLDVFGRAPPAGRAARPTRDWPLRTDRRSRAAGDRRAT